MDKNELDLVVGLMGSTFGELKQLDSSIIGASSTLNRRSEEVKKQLAEVIKQGLPPQPQVQQIPQWSPPQVQQIPTISQPQQIAPVVQPVSDPNQFEFDFSKVTKYEDIIAEISEVKKEIKAINEKLDILLQKKKKVTGT